jgi:hypothetical protein
MGQPSHTSHTVPHVFRQAIPLVAAQAISQREDVIPKVITCPLNVTFRLRNWPIAKLLRECANWQQILVWPPFRAIAARNHRAGGERLLRISP